MEIAYKFSTLGFSKLDPFLDILEHCQLSSDSKICPLTVDPSWFKIKTFLPLRHSDDSIYSVKYILETANHRLDSLPSFFIITDP